MKTKTQIFYLEKVFISFLLFIFFIFNLYKINYGLPYFTNIDEIRYQYGTLSYLSFFTGYYGFADPIVGPLISLILILKFIFINEILINFQSIDEIANKIYFNPEIFIFYGRIASLTTATISILFLYLIFKKLKINLLVYSFLLLTFASSLPVYNVASYFGKHSHFLLLFLIQLYFLFKYLVKIDKFNFKSYIIFAFLGSMAWGILYWPAFISIYAVLILHFKRFNFSKIHYLLVFFIIFVLCGPTFGMLISDVPILEFLATGEQLKNFEIISFFKNTISEFLDGIRMIYFVDKNLILTLIFLPFFLLNKNTKFKKEFFIILVIFFEPIILFALSQKTFPQLRYYVGNIGIILILTSIIFNELYKYKYLCAILIISNCLIIYNNISLHYKMNNVISKNHSFFAFNENIKQNRKKILYLVDLNFQESLKQNEFYLKLYENDLIKKNNDYENKILRIKNKIKKIKNKKNIMIINENLKKDITYYNYTYHEIDNLKLFFDHIKKNFDYIVIEESIPFYLANDILHNKINSYVKNNFQHEQIYMNENKIFLRSQMQVIHYYANAITKFDYAKNINNKKFEKIYGSNYSLFKIN